MFRHDLIIYLIEKYSAIGPNANEGKKESAATNTITTNTISPKVPVSVFKVPADSGIYFLLASMPAIATGPIIGKYRERISTKPQLIFHQGVLSPRPSKPLPLFADAEVYSYSI